jgi:prepilin-type N-terminal cleavage/methylation domain-containing protein
MAGLRGFTLIEILIALVILTVVILGLATATAQVVHVVTLADRNAAAIQLVDGRVEMIQMDPDYNGLDSAYVGTETDFPTLRGYVRETRIERVGGIGQATDHKVITVTVRGPGLSEPVSRTVTVAAP